ncbi:MAG: hypothetical protein ABMA14_05945 [Hyphomonadaceae bacterium]
MRFIVILLGLLLMLGGGAVAGAQYAPIDLSTIDVLNQVFDKVPGSREFLKTPMALYAGGGVAGFGFLLIIVAAVTGGKKKTKERPVVKPPAMARETPPRRAKPKPAAKGTDVAQPSAPPSSVAPPVMATPKPPPVAAAAPAAPVAPPVQAAPAPAAPQPQPVAAVAPAAPPKPAPAPQPSPPAAPPPVAAAPAPPKPAAPAAPPPQPVAAAPAPPTPAAPAAAPPPAPAAAPVTAKPQASAQPPAAGALPPDPRVVNRKRVQDLVSLNDALKAYHAKNGAFPQAAALAGMNERGANWLPGLAPDFVKELPHDPAHGPGTQYVYVSDGANYKLLATGVSLVNSPNVEVLGIKVDPTRNPTVESASFGFWTAGFASA